MADKTGVLIVDDSAFMRKVLTEVVDSSDDFYVAATARDGEDALIQLKKHSAEIHLITLDIQMPKMDGLECLKRIMQEDPKRVIMVSSLTTEGAKETLESLELGAIDFLAKPGGAISLDFKQVAPQLLRALKAASDADLHKPVAHEVKHAKHSEHAASVTPVHGTRNLVAVASSTGGPKALANFIPYLPKDLRAGMIVVQHMPATFTRYLAERLNKTSKITVKEAEEGDKILGGLCLIAPGGYHMEIKPDETIHLTKDPPIGGLRPCADITFNTVASVYGKRALAVVLTGMGHDGTQGCKIMRKHGSKVLVESQKTALIYGMPKSIVDNELHDRDVPINGMAQAVLDTLESM